MASASASASASDSASASKESFLSATNRRIEAVKRDSDEIDSKAFLKAVRKIPSVFALIMGEGKVSSQLANDVQGNIDSLIKVYKAKVFETLSMCPNKSTAISESPQIKLLWLKRGLNMIYQLLVTLVAHPDKSTQECAKRAYDNSLSHHHNFLMRGLASLGLGMKLPDRKELYSKFNVTADEFKKEVARFKELFRPLLLRMHAVLVKLKQETKDIKV